MFNFYVGIEHVQFTSVKSWRTELSPFHVMHLLFNLNYLIKISMDICQFIQLTRLHKSIWNVSDKLYSNRIQRTKYIAHIANEMNVTGLFS